MHLENIKRANNIYFYQNSKIQTLLTLDSLQGNQISHLYFMMSLCTRQNTINEGIISHQGGQINEYKSLVKRYKIRNRLTIAVTLVPITYFIIKKL